VDNGCGYPQLFNESPQWGFVWGFADCAGVRAIRCEGTQGFALKSAKKLLFPEEVGKGGAQLGPLVELARHATNCDWWVAANVPWNTI